ncbi:MAG: sigma 54-interacting transcriptional regulator [Acidobacteriota bacterium]|nr:sigma 54-interacting transcriptional regulator [Acidobacteriota bacterium]MDH3525367.1 sigma 54-interacting transcriptional regulator [Acidobacteriota bacterium]
MSGTAALESLFPAAPSLRPLFRQVERAARSEAPVLILGPGGSGRSTLARALHAASPRAAGALVEVDIAALPATLFESELFGFEAGAFTGAERASAGRVASAAGGTLVLDRIEEVPLGGQPKLLRLLAERRFAPLGGADRSADVRFVGIGAADLGERVRRGAFRADLFYRLEVLTFSLPPLERRKEDLPATLDYFLADLAVRTGRPGLALTERARGWMLDYSWPGNLRQVRNVLERALIERAGEAPLDPRPPADGRPRPEALAAVEKRQIEAALAYTRGRQGRAAEVLGISRKTLWEKRRKYGLP